MSELENKRAALNHLIAWRDHDARQLELYAASDSRLYENHVDVTEQYIATKRRHLAELDDLIARAHQELVLLRPE